MRTFIGIFPPPETREAALSAARKLSISGDVRWSKPPSVHLTLKFLGDVPEDRITRARRALEQACGPREPFDVKLSGFGGFPSEKRARVVWTGVGEGSEKLVSLSASLEDALASAGFPREERGYVPHLTLGRSLRRPVRLESAGAAAEVPGFTVREVSLLESELSADGAVYTVIGGYPLREGSAPDRE